MLYPGGLPPRALRGRVVRGPKRPPALLWQLLLTGLSACHTERACVEDRADVEACNRRFDSDPCSSPQGACSVACFAQLVSCEEYPGIDRGDPYSPALSRCLTKCTSSFRCKDGAEINAFWRCDGAADCADGSDEGGSCSYHVCANGQKVRETVQCDGYAHCADGSDEEGCS